MRSWLVLSAMIALATARVYIVFPVTTTTVSYTMLQPNNTMIAFEGDCFPYGFTATLIYRSNISATTTTVDAGTVYTAGTLLQPEIQNVVTLTQLPNAIENGIVKVFCVNARQRVYAISSTVQTISVSGVVTNTISYVTTKTYMIPTVASEVYPPGITAYKTTYATTSAHFITTTKVTFTTSGAIETTITLSNLITENPLRGLEMPANPISAVITTPSTVLTAVHDVLEMLIPVTVSAIAEGSKPMTTNAADTATTTVTGSIPAPILLAFASAILTKRFKKSSKKVVVTAK
ncbi:hypothetical protein [Ignicoccus hospitalis]|nr:hypothetical protein [Ignicoccus hospitalis]HIH89851.1 hypothetical protein [Desulfurococcaceae archaeon]